MKKKIITGILIVVLLAIVFSAWKFFGPTVHSPEKKYFYIHTGATYSEVVNDLLAQKIIRGKDFFNKTAGLIGYKNVRPGRYEIRKGMSLFNLARMLKNGQQSIVNFVVTKIRTKEVLAGRIGNTFECDSLQMIQFLNSPDSLREFGVDTNTAMAMVMPLTYPFRWNTTPRKIFQQFHNAWNSFWTEERKQKAERLRLSPFQVSTLASIIDEETNAPSDRPNIASVYINRIASGMPLQADPTVKFAMKNFELRRVYIDYTRFPSPYNTYINKGLPPGPICTPSTETIDAVLDSPKTEYIYFVANPAFDGTHLFTTNYEDHIKIAKLYQQELNKRNVK